MKKITVVLVLALLLSPFVAEAFDYKAWVPLLPKALGDMVPTGTPDGMNMDMGGQKWSSVTQEYQSKDGKRTAQFSVVAGQMAPQVQGFQSMVAMNMNMETGDQIVKTVTVSGKKAVVVNLEPAASVDDLTALAKDIALEQFAK